MNFIPNLKQILCLTLSQFYPLYYPNLSLTLSSLIPDFIQILSLTLTQFYAFYYLNFIPYIILIYPLPFPLLYLIFMPFIPLKLSFV